MSSCFMAALAYGACPPVAVFLDPGYDRGQACETVDETYGRFAWIVDPDGLRVELWEPKNESAD